MDNEYRHQYEMAGGEVMVDVRGDRITITDEQLGGPKRTIVIHHNSFGFTVEGLE